ncbi:cysteine desulfurase DndA [Marinospirillum insulare]|uniref:cysteine desulfurase n=1 Tax=Marinospirillum insulare TaxID=217169 RepID=A0ABQ6A0F4_9GAMM|nr:cysteine desulfurase DndA [Marinospirillum insulare]GLR63738.1 putative L-cysteine desulfurase [Marinospirillum insulare]
MTTYLDFCATTPVSKPVAELVHQFMREEFGNAGSRTHEFGLNAKRAVEVAREQVARVVEADKSEVIFTSGATESNNIAILGLVDFAAESDKKHIISSRIEHKAVIEPLEHLESKGFEITYISVGENGLIDTDELKLALRHDTLLVTLMHVNNETGCIQPIKEICELLSDHDAYFHVDAAQSYGKLSEELKNSRIDMISASGHKLYAPKGVGALVTRRRGFTKIPLKPLMYGGGQEKGLRPGTLAVPLIAGFGLACEIAYDEAKDWLKQTAFKKNVLKAELSELGAIENGENTSPYILNFSIPGINSEAAMVSFKGLIAVSNGSACTASSYKPSHVLTAMNLGHERIMGAIRLSLSPNSDIPGGDIVAALKRLI